MKITSFSNPTIKAIRKLAEHKERAATGLFLAEGLRIVAEALQCNSSIESVIISTELLVSEFGKSLLDLVKERNIPILDVTPSIFESISIKEGPQGIAAVVRQNWSNLEEVKTTSDQIWIALESIQNPGNLGSIMRTSEAIGASGIILLEHCTDPYDPTSVKASMGAIFSLELIKSELDTFVKWTTINQVPIIGTSDKAASDYMDVNYPCPCVLLMGSERQGLPQKYLDLCTEIVRIPMQGRSDSLNLAIAASIVLYQIYNQKRMKIR